MSQEERSRMLLNARLDEQSYAMSAWCDTTWMIKESIIRPAHGAQLMRIPKAVYELPLSSQRSERGT